MSQKKCSNLIATLKIANYYKNNFDEWEKTIPKISEPIPLNPNRIEGGYSTRSEFKSRIKSVSPLVSVITIVYNGKTYLEQTIQSVLNQTYTNIEYIIIDGGSTDGTIDIIRKYDDQIAYWVSEPDNGISDAFNKGIKCSNGEIIGTINADDWYKPDAVELSVRELVENPDFGFSFGALELYKGNKYSHINKADERYREVIKYNIPAINHPTLFVRRTTYEKCGLFSVQLKYSMDYDFFMRMYVKNIKSVCLKETIACMRIEGVSFKASNVPLFEILLCSVIYRQLSLELAILLYLIRFSKGTIRRIMENCGMEHELHILRKALERNYRV
jgi:glycosyltransferase involved in cell wall biosynthesis